MLAAFPLDAALCAVVIYFRFVLIEIFFFLHFLKSFLLDTRDFPGSYNGRRKPKGSWIEMPLLPNDIIQGRN